MQRLQKQSHVETESVVNLAVNTCSDLIERSRKREPDPRLFDSLYNALASLPLATSEFGLAKNRFENAQSYFLKNLYTAAGIELKMLHNLLVKSFPTPREPNRRLRRIGKTDQGSAS